MTKLLVCVIFLFSLGCQASINCIMDKPGCNTIKGLVLSQKIDESHYGVYINDVLVKSYETSNISDAFVYNDFGFKEDGKGRVEKLLITYNAKDCITDYTQVRCTKYVMIDLTGDKVFFSEPFYPPVVNSMLLNAKWGKKTIMKFEDKSVFEYENKKIRMTDGGVMAQQAEIDRRKLESKK